MCVSDGRNVPNSRAWDLCLVIELGPRIIHPNIEEKQQLLHVLSCLGDQFSVGTQYLPHCLIQSSHYPYFTLETNTQTPPSKYSLPLVIVGPSVSVEWCVFNRNQTLSLALFPGWWYMQHEPPLGCWTGQQAAASSQLHDHKEKQRTVCSILCC